MSTIAEKKLEHEKRLEANRTFFEEGQKVRFKHNVWDITVPPSSKVFEIERIEDYPARDGSQLIKLKGFIFMESGSSLMKEEDYE